MLHCNRRIGARERRQLIPHVRFQVPFLGPESQLKSGFACAGLPCSASQICLQNLCGQQQNSLMADPTFGSKSGSQNGAQAKTYWGDFHLCLRFCVGFVGQKQTLSLVHNSTSILTNVSPLVSYTYGFAILLSIGFTSFKIFGFPFAIVIAGVTS